MNKLLLALVAVLMSVSCSLDKRLDKNEGNPISFTSEMAPTRATDFVTTGNMDYFYSTAFNAAGEVYFDKQLFEKQGSGFFTSSPEYYWPGDGSDLRFYCYSTSAIKSDMGLSVPSGTSTEYYLKDVTPKDDVSQQVDFVYGFATGNKTNQETGMSLKMRHGFAQVGLMAKNNNEGYVYTVTGVKLAFVASNGDFRFPESSEDKGFWTPDFNNKAVYRTTYAAAPVKLNATAQSIMGGSGNFVIVPQKPTAWLYTDKTNVNEGAYLAVQIDIKTKAGAQVYNGWAATNISDEWSQGNIYTYILDFSAGAGYVDPKEPGTPGNPGDEILGGPIKFVLDSVVDWATISDSNVPM